MSIERIESIDRIYRAHSLDHIISWSTVRAVTEPRDEPLITSGEVARRLGVTTGAIGAWVRQGVLQPAFRTPGGRNRFRWSEVQEQLRAARERDGWVQRQAPAPTGAVEPVRSTQLPLSTAVAAIARSAAAGTTYLVRMRTAGNDPARMDR
jgi:excisionase family DNA binding protein